MFRVLIFIAFIFTFIYYITVVLMAFNIVQIGEKKISWKSYIPFYQWFIKDVKTNKTNKK